MTAGTDHAGAARAVVEHDAGDLLGLTAALVAVPSVHPDEGLLADAIEERLRARAGALRVERRGDNVVARTDHGAARRVLLGGHLDTVQPAGNATPRVEGDVCWGLGTADMKGSLAVLLRLAEEVASRRPRVDVSFLFYAGEEVAEEHNGLRHLFSEAPDLVGCDLAILCEPTGGWVEAGCQGTLHVEAVFRGARAHTARPWTGENAIHRAAPVLGRLAATEAATVDVDGLAYRESLQVVRIAGGVRNNVVPDECALVVNRRYAPDRPMEVALGEVEALLAGADEVHVRNASPAAPPNLADPLVAEFVGTLDLSVRPKLGWTDVARFAAAGVPALNFGAGDPELAHTPDERVPRTDLEGCHAVLARFLGSARAG